MKQHKIAELTGLHLNAAVAQALAGNPWVAYPTGWYLAVPERGLLWAMRFDAARAYSTDWAHGGPLVEEKQIAVWHDPYAYGVCGEEWVAGFALTAEVEHGPSSMGDGAILDANDAARGKTPLIAAMRALVQRAAGSRAKTVELPE